MPWPRSEPILLFARQDTLVAIESLGRRVEVWQLPLGAQLASFDLPDYPDLRPGRIALSPGGRYLVLSVEGIPTEVATFYDLTTGKEAGSLIRRARDVNPYFLAFAFSHDGKEFAGYMSGLGNVNGLEGVHHGMVVWDVKTGRPIYEAPYEYSGGFDAAYSASDRPLQWFPDKQGWLISQVHVFDRERREVVRSLTEYMHAGVEPTGAQILDDRRLLISDASVSRMTILENYREAPAKKE